MYLKDLYAIEVEIHPGLWRYYGQINAVIYTDGAKAPLSLLKHAFETKEEAQSFLNDHFRSNAQVKHTQIRFKNYNEYLQAKSKL